MEAEYYDALKSCASKYFYLTQRCLTYPFSESDKALLLFILEFDRGIKERMPLMKLNRWLGYIQGCMIERGYTTVQAERDWTRPLFRHLDYGDV